MPRAVRRTEREILDSHGSEDAPAAWRSRERAKEVRRVACAVELLRQTARADAPAAVEGSLVRKHQIAPACLKLVSTRAALLVRHDFQRTRLHPFPRLAHVHFHDELADWE